MKDFLISPEVITGETENEERVVAFEKSTSSILKDFGNFMVYVSFNLTTIESGYWVFISEISSVLISKTTPPENSMDFLKGLREITQNETTLKTK